MCSNALWMLAHAGEPSGDRWLKHHKHTCTQPGWRKGQRLETGWLERGLERESVGVFSCVPFCRRFWGLCFLCASLVKRCLHRFVLSYPSSPPTPLEPFGQVSKWLGAPEGCLTARLLPHTLFLTQRSRDKGQIHGWKPSCRGNQFKWVYSTFTLKETDPWWRNEKTHCHLKKKPNSPWN